MRAARFTGKTCFVTGAAQGIGRAIAARLAAEGGTVLAADLRFDDDSGPPPNLTRIVLDVTDEAAVAAAAAAHGNVGVLINCVGYVATGNILAGSMADFDRSMALNVRSMVLTCRAFLPAMVARGSGAIVNIASVVSHVKAAPDRCAYATSKAAVVALTSAIARDFVHAGIRCNAISPGTVDSPSLQQRLAATGDPVAARTAFVARQPMGRLGEPDEIAVVAALLASDEAPFMTGSNVIIDGGMSL